MTGQQLDIRCPHCGLAPVEPAKVSVVDGCAVFRGKSVRLTPIQIRALNVLAPGRRISRTLLYQELYWDHSEATEPEPQAIDVHVCHLRKKLAVIGLKIGSNNSIGWQLTESEVIA